jgi:hypothetical protein
MRYRKPDELQRELNARVPRGSLDQNLFRARVWLWRHQGHSFDDSVLKARAQIRRRTPGFEPRLRSVE